MITNKGSDKKLVIGLLGRPGCGKAICTAELVSLCASSNISVEKITFSDLLRQTLDEYGVVPDRSNLQQLAIFMNDRRRGALGYKMRSLVEQSPSKVVIVDGIRWNEDFEMVRSFPNSLIVYITAPQQARFERLKARGQKPGESEMSFEDFIKSESVSTETDIETLGEQADLEIENDETVVDFQKKIANVWETRTLPTLNALGK